MMSQTQTLSIFSDNGMKELNNKIKENNFKE